MTAITAALVLAPLLAAVVSIGGHGTAEHMLRVGALAAACTAEAGWEPRRSALLWIHGALHDLGKGALHASVLQKPGPLTGAERRHVERHTTAGFRLLHRCRVPVLRDTARVARDHHEWWNGRGYPRGIAGDRIDANARAVAIADVYDALTSARPYRAALASDAALDLMRRGRGVQFDPDLLDAFLRLLRRPDEDSWCTRLV